MPTQNIGSLGLSAKAKKAAEELLKQFPDIEFTSGKRELSDQARAMSQNVVKNRKWIGQTYAKNKASGACQKWVDDNPDATKASDIEKGLLKTLKDLGPAAGQISKHLTGDAFDIQPVNKNASEIKAAIKKLPGLGKFLEKEGGLVRWHVQF